MDSITLLTYRGIREKRGRESLDLQEVGRRNTNGSLMSHFIILRINYLI